MRASPRQELVIILHGIGMPKMRMTFIDFSLKRAGYKTLNLAYPSLRNDIESCAAFIVKKLDGIIPNNIKKIHFVAHSMGCLVSLQTMKTAKLDRIGRAVFIAPPFRGSEVADFLHQNALYKFAFGPAGAQLTTHYRRELNHTPPAGLEIGVIAGSRGYEYPLFLHIMKKTGVHDGLVALSSTQVDGLKDHITIRMSHSFLLERSVSQIMHFLENGNFYREHG